MMFPDKLLRLRGESHHLVVFGPVLRLDRMRALERPC